MNRRRAYSLIELIVVTGLSTVLMGIAVTLLYALIRTGDVSRDHVHQYTVMGRLAEQFRDDVHATTADPSSDGDAIRFEVAPDRSVVYRAEAGLLMRIERDGQGVRRRESYALPPETTASIEISDATQPPVVSLLITAAAETPGRVMRIDAVAKKDHRFSEPNERSDEEEKNDG